MSEPKLILDYVFDHEASHPDTVYLTQPIGDGQTIEYSWAQTLDQARRVASHLQSKGLAPGARVAILSKNCAHFFMAELAIWMAGATTVAIYPTETSDTVRYVLEHSGTSLLFVGKLDGWGRQAPGVSPAIPCIALPLAPHTDFETWDEIVATTPPLPGYPRRAPEDLAMLMYTSGSTGQPKGVMHCFESITCASEYIAEDLKSRVGGKLESRVLSYLPLAHVFERAWIECASMVDGNMHVFFTESLDSFPHDLKRARPTVFISVPRLWLKFRQGVLAKMSPEKLDQLLCIPILGRIVRRKILKGLGLDQVLLAGSGSAPIPAELIAWYLRLGLNLYEGYAMTEDFAYSHISTEALTVPGYVGVPMPGVEVRISDDGEVLIKSPGHMLGYYHRPDLDADCFTADGFFCTGDLGERRQDGLLKITGRVKELFKTSKGKYVAPVPIENRLNSHPFVEFALVSGTGQQAAYALVVLSEALRPKVGDPIVREKVDHELAQLLKDVNQSLADYEQLRMIVVSPEPWTIENGCLTPTMKLRRIRIELAVSAQVPTWYAANNPVHWA